MYTTNIMDKIADVNKKLYKYTNKLYFFCESAQKD